MFPAQALAEEMLARGWRVRLSTDARGRRYAGGFPDQTTIAQVTSATFARGGVLAKALAPFLIVAGVVSALWAMRRDPPAVVVGFGGYPSIPALVAAWVLRLRRMIHEQNGVLGRVNALLARRVDAVACGTWPTALPEGVTGVHTGNPVRDGVAARLGAPYIPPGDYPMSVLVFGGSQGARIISEIVPAALAGLPDRIKARLRVSHQARDEDAAMVRKAYGQGGVRVEIASFFDDLPTRMAEAQLVVCRSGASSVADLCVIGRPSILIPFAAAAADHQMANARALVEAGGAVLIAEAQLDAEGLTAQIAAILTNPKRAVKMAHAALALATPNAAKDLAEMIENLNRRREP